MSTPLHKNEILEFHKQGKFKTVPKQLLTNQKHLSIAYSPGVAEVSLEIQQNPASAFDYTTKGNLVAVISNGTAVLGLGNIGALASKPVMEGKSVLFKSFAAIDSIDIEIDEHDADKFIEIVKKISPTFGGINLEDIKAPECFAIEKALTQELDIPVMHDDQHGTAIIAFSGILNALELVNKKINEVKMVVIGAGAAAISCAKICKDGGIKEVMMVDSKGVITADREDINAYKREFVVDKHLGTTLDEAIKGADIVLGLSQPKQITEAMLKSMAKDPIVFAMANPNPEILPEVAKAVRSDVIIGTGRSDYPNQVNNVLGFPYIFRGALDVRAKSITENMKIAAAHALAALAKEEVPKYIKDIYGELSFGRDYIIPTPFDRRLLEFLAPAIADAAIKDGVAQKDIDLQAYKIHCKELSNSL